jgi:hypothetical protein
MPRITRIIKAKNRSSIKIEKIQMEDGNLKAIENINYDQVTVLKSAPLIDFVLSFVALFLPF